MSVAGLGKKAKCGELIADKLQRAELRVAIAPDPITANPSLGLPLAGFHLLAPAVNPTALVLPAGVEKGQVVEFLHLGGANAGVITPSALHGAAVSVSLAGGAYVKLIWNGSEWFLIGRESSAVAATGVVAGLPIVA